MIPSSSSLMLPFMPSSRRSFGRHGSAQREQMMPITSVGRESRGVETEHRANLSGAQGGNQAIEARSFDGATCSTTEIVVDHFDIGEAASTCGHQIPVACRS